MMHTNAANWTPMLSRLAGFLILGHFVTGPLGHSAVAYADVPHLIRYQGTAVDAQGVPVEGARDLTFRLYTTATGGSAVWTETHEAIEVTKGHFAVLLGSSGSPLTGMDWAQPCWLSVQINQVNKTDVPELSPRQQITSVPTAIVASKLATPVATSNITDDDNALVPTGTIILWDGPTCPTGYGRVSAYDGRFLLASATAGDPGGSDTHTHGPGSYVIPNHSHGNEPHFHTYYSDGNADFRSTSPPAGTTTTHGGTNSGGGGSVTGASGTTDSRPAFMTILLCKKE